MQTECGINRVVTSLPFGSFIPMLCAVIFSMSTIRSCTLQSVPLLIRVHTYIHAWCVDSLHTDTDSIYRCVAACTRWAIRAEQSKIILRT